MPAPLHISRRQGKCRAKTQRHSVRGIPMQANVNHRIIRLAHSDIDLFVRTHTISKDSSDLVISLRVHMNAISMYYLSYLYFNHITLPSSVMISFEIICLSPTAGSAYRDQHPNRKADNRSAPVCDPRPKGLNVVVFSANAFPLCSPPTSIHASKGPPAERLPDRRQHRSECVVWNTGGRSDARSSSHAPAVPIAERCGCRGLRRHGPLAVPRRRSPPATAGAGNQNGRRLPDVRGHPRPELTRDRLLKTFDDHADREYVDVDRQAATSPQPAGAA